MITLARLRELLIYSPETGNWAWAIKVNGRRAGDAAGSITKYGYWCIGIDGRLYQAHRLAWLYMTGVWPEADIDHVDLDRANNRWPNLRAATRTQNNGNKRAQSNNRCGLKGVSWEGFTAKWRAQIRINGKPHNIGRFDTPEAAHAAYVVAAERLFGEFARG